MLEVFSLDMSLEASCEIESQPTENELQSTHRSGGLTNRSGMHSARNNKAGITSKIYDQLITAGNSADSIQIISLTFIN